MALAARICVLAAGLLAASCASQGDTFPGADERYDDVIHADLPLFRSGDAKVPWRFTDGESFGCTSNIEMGDWRLKRDRDADDEDPEWIRITQYGAFHCWAVFRREDERTALENAEAIPAFFVPLGAAKIGSKTKELWTLQIGVRPGSEYVLLARDAESKDVIQGFDVLRVVCPRERVRDAGAIEILRTRYCAINTVSDLKALARNMALQRRRGELIWAAKAPDERE
ncbi:MAG: hypothetical protein K2Q06_00660 [Parvularculaceae bacterium]|nr:hypothetical protein [Parvularculaceae bacterium]